jgi:signal transduction histidine kinase
MGKLIGGLGATLGSALGWWAGARVGIMTAFICSMIGTGLGLYLARRWAQEHLS